MWKKTVKKKLDDYAYAWSESEDPWRIDSIADGFIKNSVSAFFNGSAKEIIRLERYYEKRKSKYDDKT